MDGLGPAKDNNMRSHVVVQVTGMATQGLIATGCLGIKSPILTKDRPGPVPGEDRDPSMGRQKTAPDTRGRRRVGHPSVDTLSLPTEGLDPALEGSKDPATSRKETALDMQGRNTTAQPPRVMLILTMVSQDPEVQTLTDLDRHNQGTAPATHSLGMDTQHLHPREAETKGPALVNTVIVKDTRKIQTHSRGLVQETTMDLPMASQETALAPDIRGPIEDRQPTTGRLSLPRNTQTPVPIEDKDLARDNR